MKAISLVSYTILSILVILLLSTAAQATEYREVGTEVKAEDILKQIENGEDINLTDCRIVGELKVSNITLETFPKSDSDKLLKNVSVIKSNITITNSIFENDLYFSNMLFNNPANFSGATFNDYIDFSGATFNDYVDFSGATFNDYVDFSGATFNDYVDFSGATFNNSAYFYWANFHGSADFMMMNFHGSADFSGANFNSSTSFMMTIFHDSAYFSDVSFNGDTYFSLANFISSASFFSSNFNSTAYFIYADFNSSAYFGEPATGSENIITDGKTCEFFMKNFNNQARYTDADNIYYNYRRNFQKDKSFTSFSKWTDILSWITCGYGTKLSYTLIWTVVFIISFAIIYKSPSISYKTENKRTLIRLFWGKPGIYRKEKNNEESVSFLEALYFSICIFTRLGSEDWKQKDSFRKWVSLESVLGWIIFALVSATLMRLFIRP
jgi:uncharacterized protein YjbI with pentapeptide repeats